MGERTTLSDRLAATEARPQAESACTCDLRTRLVGDGCAVCNPQLAREVAEDAAPQPQAAPSLWVRGDFDSTTDAPFIAEKWKAEGHAVTAYCKRDPRAMQKSYAIEVERAGRQTMRLVATDAAMANEAAQILKDGCTEALVRFQGHPCDDPLRLVWLTVVTQSLGDVPSSPCTGLIACGDGDRK